MSWMNENLRRHQAEPLPVYNRSRFTARNAAGSDGAFGLKVVWLRSSKGVAAASSLRGRGRLSPLGPGEAAVPFRRRLLCLWHRHGSGYLPSYPRQQKNPHCVGFCCAQLGKPSLLEAENCTCLSSATCTWTWQGGREAPSPSPFLRSSSNLLP